MSSASNPAVGRPSSRAHGGATLAQVAEADEVVDHVPRVCSGCGGSLERSPVVSLEARQVFDVPPVRLPVVENRLQHRRCACGARTSPARGAGPPAQYGPGVRAIAAYLTTAQRLSDEQAACVMHDLLGAPVDAGSIASWVAGSAAHPPDPGSRGEPVASAPAGCARAPSPDDQRRRARPEPPATRMLRSVVDRFSPLVAPGPRAGHGPRSAPPAAQGPVTAPVSRERVARALASAEDWAASLPPAADRLQLKADGLSIAAGVVGVITGLTVYTTWTDGPGAGSWARVVAVVLAIATGVLALVPRVKRYAERAQEVRTLASRYGEVFGKLKDVHHLPGGGTDDVARFQQCARTAMDEFQSVKVQKDKIPRVSKVKPTAGRPRTGYVVEDASVRPQSSRWRSAPISR